VNKPQLFCAAVHVPHAANFDREREFAINRLARQLATAIVDKSVGTQRDKFSTEYRLSIMVMTPDEFYAATRIYGAAFGREPIVSFDEKG
jgi:hypothetical protein